jgi:hypothetical protein
MGGSRAMLRSGVGLFGWPAPPEDFAVLSSPFSNMDPLMDSCAEPGERLCFQGCPILDCARILMKLMMTVTENIVAMTRPMTTRGMGATSRRSTNAMVRALHRSLTLAKNVENTSPPLVVHGRRAR